MSAALIRSSSPDPTTTVPETSAVELLNELLRRFMLPKSLVDDLGHRCRVQDRYDRQKTLAVGRVALVAPNHRGQLTILVEPDYGETPLDDNMPHGMLLLEGSTLDTLYLIQQAPRLGSREIAVRLIIM